MTPSFAEGFAIAAGITQAFVAFTFLRFRSSRPGWGLGWLGLAYGLAALLNTGSPLFMNIAGQSGLGTVHGLLGLVLGVSTMGGLFAGAHLYTQSRRIRPWTAFWLMWALYIVVVGTRVAVGPSLDNLGNLFTAVLFIYLCGLFVEARQREPDAGHGHAAAMLALYPPMVLGSHWIGLDPMEVRYWATVPFTLAGLGIMSATMGRMRAELMTLNESLETRVTERTRDLQDLVTSLESFNSMVSHDLRGSLGGISGLSGVALQALDVGDTDKARRLFSLIQQEAAQLSELVTDLLTLARVSHAELNIQTVSLETILQDAVDALEVHHGEGYGACIEHEPLPAANVDPRLMRQVLVNLLGNALKYARNSQPQRVQVHSRPQADGVLIEIEDNGVGFDPRESGDLFAPFKRLRSATGYEGTGVGLTIVKRIVERHGGRVWAARGAECGAVFSLWLPASPG
jgi:signal transduction histidine kinase